MNQFLRELCRFLPIGLSLFWTVNAIESNLDFFIGVIQNGDGITIGNVNDFGVEVGGAVLATNVC